MANQKNSNPPIIPANAPKPDEGMFVIVYGKGGIGKTTTTCMADRALLLDCTGGGRHQQIDYWRIYSTDDLHAALEYLEKGGHGYSAVILDSVDNLYSRSLKPERDIRKSHKDAQGILKPMLVRFGSLPIHRILVLNEKVDQREDRVRDEEGQLVWKKFIDIHLNLPPTLSQLVDDMCDVLIRAENPGRTDDDGNRTPTTIRVVRVAESQVNVQAKTRFDIVRNRMLLTQALINLGIIRDTAPATEAEQPALIPAGK